MLSEVIPMSAEKNNSNASDKKPLQFGSHSSRSDKYVSASKSNKAFEDSLRKAEPLNCKPENSINSLRRRLPFGKSDQNQSNENKKIYIVDLHKKIKKVESPFLDSESPSQLKQKHQCSETNLLVSSFDAIEERISDQAESLASVQKNNNHTEGIEFKNLSLEIHDMIEEPSGPSHQSEQNHEENTEFISNESQQRSSQNISSKSESEQILKLRKKEKKIKKKKQKTVMAKQVKEKLKNITNFVDQLHQKEAHTDRKELISELREHLFETKFGRLRNQLKKLI